MQTSRSEREGRGWKAELEEQKERLPLTLDPGHPFLRARLKAPLCLWSMRLRLSSPFCPPVRSKTPRYSGRCARSCSDGDNRKGVSRYSKPRMMPHPGVCPKKE